MHRPMPDSLIDAINRGEVNPEDVDPLLWAETERYDDLAEAADLMRKAEQEGAL